MADYSRREVVTRRVEYLLPKPCNAAELGKAYAAAEREARQSGLPIADDTLWVDATDEEITISFVVPVKPAKAASDG